MRGKRNHKFRTLVRSDLGDTGVYMTADSLFDAKSKLVLIMIMISDNKYLHILNCGSIFDFIGQTISKANYGFLNFPKKQTNLIILSKEHAQDSEFCSFFWEN